MLPGMSLFGGGHADCYIEFHFGVKNEENFEIRFFGLFLTSIGCQYGPVWMCSETQNGKFGEKQKPENSFPRPLFFHRFPFRGFLEKKPKIKAGRPAGQPAGRRWRPPLGRLACKIPNQIFRTFSDLESKITSLIVSRRPTENIKKVICFCSRRRHPGSPSMRTTIYNSVFLRFFKSSGRALGELWESSGRALFRTFSDLESNITSLIVSRGPTENIKKVIFFALGDATPDHPACGLLYTNPFFKGFSRALGEL